MAHHQEGLSMHYAVTRLRMTDFRNYGALALDPAEGSVVLTGENGAGKTNLLEALSYLAPGRGLRGAKLGDVGRLDAKAPDTKIGTWSVAATVDGPEGPVDVGTGLQPRPGSDAEAVRRVVHIDRQPASGPAALGDVVRMMWLTPQMDRLFIEGPSHRRRFLDRLVMALTPSHGAEVSAYERAMRERNRLMAQGRPDPAWLGALEGRMAAHGVAIAASRLDGIARLAFGMEEATGAFPTGVLDVTGVLEDQLKSRSALEVEDMFRARLAANRDRDAAAGRALEGPHGSDMRVHHGQTGMAAELCSTGEQKALLIGITLASARLVAAETAAPILLLDEVAAHLDERRRAALFEELDDLGSQCWMTGTDPALFGAIGAGAAFYRVDAGTIRPVFSKSA
jgi:DNA replication and repair protein RecF